MTYLYACMFLYVYKLKMSSKYCSCNKDTHNTMKVKKNVENKEFNKFCTCTQHGYPGIKKAMEGLYGFH